MANQIVHRMLDVIETDYASIVTLRTLSSTVGRQPTYLGRLFRQEMGSTARDYLTRVRLERAAALIREGVKIEAVALSVGYRSKKNFYQQFRKHYGTTPLLYRSDVTGGGGAEHGSPAVSVGQAAALPSAASSPAPSFPARPSAAPYPSGELGPAMGRPSTTFGAVAPIIRASNRAWRLAIQAQQMMVEHFHRFRMAMLITDLEERYVGANRAALATTGWTPALPRCGVVIITRSVVSIGRRGSERKAATPASVLSGSA